MRGRAAGRKPQEGGKAAALLAPSLFVCFVHESEDVQHALH
jgi:hypothetical protein